MRPTDRVVLELSSFQLHDLRRTGFRPSIAVVTNLFPDHLDRHGTFDHYAASKRAILEAQTADDVAVLPGEDAALAAHGFANAGRARRVRFGGPGEAVPAPGVRVTASGGLSEVGGRREGGNSGAATGTELPAFALWGAHNRRNAAAAAAAALAAGCTWAEVRAGAAATQPLPHRLQPVHEAGGVLFIDDSIATTPQCTAAALEAVPRRCIVLVGGKEKGTAPTALVEALRAHAKGVVGIGTTGAMVVDLVRRGTSIPAVTATGGPDLAAAMKTALAMASPGDAVLLSPGFSSLDQYASFAVRGDAFAKAAREATGGG
jgi:UDP-N-acetylmuramoylalanine--D-glutamate ligase